MMVKSVTRFCEREGWIHRDPFRHFDFLPEEQADFTFLNENEVLQLTDSLDGDLHLSSLYMLALNTGMREGEICGLQRKDIDLARKQIMVKYSLSSAGQLEATKTK